MQSNQFIGNLKATAAEAVGNSLRRTNRLSIPYAIFRG